MLKVYSKLLLYTGILQYSKSLIYAISQIRDEGYAFFLNYFTLRNNLC